MNKHTLLFGVLLVGSLSQVQVVANEILIYKATSKRPWTETICHRPYSTAAATPPVPLAPRSGTYTQTEYWIYDKTAQKAVIINYTTAPYLGSTVKQYSVSQEQDFSSTAGFRAQRLIKSNVANGFFHCLSDGSQFDGIIDLDGDGTDDESSDYYELNLAGAAKPFVVSPSLTFQGVATKLTGPWIYTSDDSYLTSTSDVKTRSLYRETATTTLILDVAGTKLCNTGSSITPYAGGSSQTAGTLAYGVTKIENDLFRLGYDKEPSIE
jgi:hypothetical protein